MENEEWIQEASFARCGYVTVGQFYHVSIIICNVQESIKFPIYLTSSDF